LDVTGSKRLLGLPEDIAKKIKERVLVETGLTVSAGVAPSKFVAKIASDMDKPDGLTVVRPDYVRDFLDPLPVRKMWGAGKVTQKALAQLNIRTFRDLRQTPVEILEKRLGKQGLKMHELALGIDERDVIPDHDVKSIGHEETFATDITDKDHASKELLSLSNRVARRLRLKGVTGKTITLKVKYSDFVQITRSKTLPNATDDGQEIYAVVVSLLEKTGVGKRPVRLLGVSLSQLGFSCSEGQLSFFDGNGPSQKRKDLNKALDALYEKHGYNSIRPGTLIRK
jgi:DNA polymerase-4